MLVRNLLNIVGISALLLPFVYFLGQMAVEVFNFWQWFWQLKVLAVWGRSLLLVMLSVLGSLLLGAGLAFGFNAYDFVGKRVLIGLLSLPMLIPSYVFALVWIAVFGGVGWQWWESIRWVSDAGLDGLLGSVVVVIIVTFPYVFLQLLAALKTKSVECEEAALVLGKSSRQIFWQITLPSIYPAVAASLLLVSLYALSDFGAISLFQYDVFTRQIYLNFVTSFSLKEAFFWVMILLVQVGLFLLMMKRFLHLEHQFVGSQVSKRMTSHRGKWLFLTFGFLVLFIAVIVPLAVLFWWSWQGLIERGLVLAFDWEALMNTVLMAGGVAIFSVLISLGLVLINQKKWRKWWEKTMYLCHGIPGVVLGLLMVGLVLDWFPVVYQTLFLLAAVYFLRFVVQAFGPIKQAYGQINQSWLDSAVLLNKSRWNVFRCLVLPLLKPGVLVGGLLVFVGVVKELPATLILAPVEFDTVAVKAWSLAEEGFFAEAAIYSLVIVVIVLMVWLLISGLEKRL